MTPSSRFQHMFRLDGGAIAENGELEALTGVRAVLAAWICSLHFSPQLGLLFPGARGVMDYLMAGGWASLDLFFMLSGFIISYTYLERTARWDVEAYSRFLRKRFARIYPVHATCLGILVALVVLGIRPSEPRDLSLGSLLQGVLLVQSWTTPVLKSWNVVSWSISSEWLAYICFPLFAWVVRRVQHPLYFLAIAVVGWGLFAIPVRLLEYGSHMEYGTFRIVADFLIGCATFQLFRSPWLRALPVWPLVTVLGLPVMMLGFARLGGDVKAIAFYGPPILGGFLFALATDRTVAPWLFGNRLFVYFGRVSYSFYLVHGIALLYVKDFPVYEHFVGRGLLWAWACVVLYAGTLVAASVAMYHWIELPMREALTRPSAARAASPSPQPAAQPAPAGRISAPGIG